MKRTKRKYTRKATTTPTEEATKGIEAESKVIVGVLLSGGIPEGMVLPESVTTTSNTLYKEFSFNDLPLSVRTLVEEVITYRKRRGLPDDSKERKVQAVRMFRGDRPR